MLVFQAPYKASSGVIASFYDETQTIRMPATTVAIEALTNLPHAPPKRPLPQIRAVETNITASRSLEALDSSQLYALTAITETNEDLLKLVCDLSYRRIQLFYYLLVAYHDEKCYPRKARPKMQHGKTSNSECFTVVYPSLYPRIKDTFFKGLADKIKRRTIDARTEKIMESLKVNLTAAALDEASPAGVKLMEICGTAKSLLSKQSDFYQNLQQTIEVPSLVGEYNAVIENFTGELGDEILAACSEGKLSPSEGCAAFVKNLGNFFYSSIQETNEKSVAYQRCGELCDAILKMEDDVLHEKSIEPSNYVASTFELLYLMGSIDEYKRSLPIGIALGRALHERRNLFSWMIGFLRKDIDYGVNIDKPTEFEKFYGKVKGRLDSYQEFDGELVNVLSRNMSIEEKKERLKNCNIIDYCFADGKRYSQFPKLLTDKLRHIPSLPKINFQEELDALEQSIIVIDWMQKASVMPSEEFLSGIVENEKLRPMTADELFYQKLEIITRKSVEST